MLRVERVQRPEGKLEPVGLGLFAAEKQHRPVRRRLRARAKRSTSTAFGRISQPPRGSPRNLSAESFENAL